MSEPRPSIQQEYFPTLLCFGCGPANAKGLRISSFLDADDVVRATFAPWPEHDNGLGYLNGGIISTLLDCHSAAAVAVTSERIGVPQSGGLQFVTAELDVRFRRPSPLREPVELTASVTSADESVIVVEAELWWLGLQRAAASATWKRWRPRPGAPVPGTH